MDKTLKDLAENLDLAPSDTMATTPVPATSTPPHWTLPDLALLGEAEIANAHDLNNVGDDRQKFAAAILAKTMSDINDQLVARLAGLWANT